MATGPMPTVSFSGTGMFSVDLTVSDGLATDMCSAAVTIEDTTPPVVECTVAESELWPPNHDLVDVGLMATATDLCAGTLPGTVEVFGDEDDEMQSGDGNFSPDAKQDPALRLRAERQGNSDGRVYLILATAAGPSGNVGHACCTVTVPHSRSAAAIASVQAQAAGASSFCDANAAAPLATSWLATVPWSGRSSSRQARKPEAAASTRFRRRNTPSSACRGPRPFLAPVSGNPCRPRSRNALSEQRTRRTSIQYAIARYHEAIP